jgi:hypothetical protein
MYEKYLTPPQLSAKVNGDFTPDAIRGFCKRGPENHPLPHLAEGTPRRTVYKIRPSKFDKWLDEEEALCLEGGKW